MYVNNMHEHEALSMSQLKTTHDITHGGTCMLSFVKCVCLLSYTHVCPLPMFRDVYPSHVDAPVCVDSLDVPLHTATERVLLPPAISIPDSATSNPLYGHHRKGYGERTMEEVQ
jgi:hypothetical protein